MVVSQDATNGGRAGRSFVDRQDEFLRPIGISQHLLLQFRYKWFMISSVWAPAFACHSNWFPHPLTHSLTHGLSPPRQDRHLGLRRTLFHTSSDALPQSLTEQRILLLFVSSFDVEFYSIRRVVRSFVPKNVRCFPRCERRSHNLHALDCSAQMIVLCVRLRSTGMHRSNDGWLNAIFFFIVFHYFV